MMVVLCMAGGLSRLENDGREMMKMHKSGEGGARGYLANMYKSISDNRWIECRSYQPRSISLLS